MYIVHVLAFASLRGFLHFISSVMLQFVFFAFHFSTYRPCLSSLWCYFDIIGIVAFFRSIMARSPDKIKSIDGSKETLKLSIYYLLFRPLCCNFNAIQGDEIHAVCKQDQLKVCDHQFKLVFIGVTVVRECVLEDIPFRKYRFAGFADVVAGQFEPGLLVDVIGVVEEVVFRQVSGKGRRVVFKLKDLSHQLLSCTLWDDYCLQFLKFLDDYEGDGPIIVLLTHGRIKEAQGLQSWALRPAQVLNPMVKEESFFGKAEAKTIAEINTISEEIVCVTIGTITRIVLDNHSWCYTACIQCHKKSNAEMAPFTYACSKYNKEVVLRYRLEVMINHEDENTKFLLWDRECSELIGQSADAINKLKIEDGNVDLNASPQALDKLLGYELAFKIKVQPKFKNSPVLKCSADSSLINVVMDMLADAETSSKMNIPISDSNHSAQHESQSVSVTVDHDPLLGLPLTPTKRQAFQDCDDEAGTSQISHAQLSFNKLKKHGTIYIKNMDNHQHANHSDTAQARIKKKANIHDSSEDKSSESTQGYSDLGDQLMQCSHCNANMWYDERVSKHKRTTNPRFSLCCGSGKVELPLLQNPPKYLCQLLYDHGTSNSKNYQQNIRIYNMMFAFTSAGIKFDKSINHSRGPPTIRIQGQPCHRIGNMLPMPGKEPKFAQLYIFDTKNEVRNRINAIRMARDRLQDAQVDNIKLKLIANREKNGRTYNVPTVPEVTTLIVGDFDANLKRDIIIETQHGQLQRIHGLHSSYLALQYFLLFSYGEDGYRSYILHSSPSDGYNADQMSQKNLLNSRRLFQQFVVEGYTMVESEILSYIRNNQKKLRIDKFCSLQQSLDDGSTKGLNKELLQANQRSLRDYPSMPYPEDANCPAYLDNNLILAELNYNNQELR
ncbi:Replication protein A DNA-binding subunit E [Glycine soja]